MRCNLQVFTLLVILSSIINPNLHIANFYFYRYHFVQTGDKNLFSKEDNEKVTGEYLNMKFADDLLGKSFAGMMVLTCMGLSRIEVALSRRSLM